MAFISQPVNIYGMLCLLKDLHHAEMASRGDWGEMKHETVTINFNCDNA